ncbi:purine phosphorylase [Sphingobium sufflavum]|uniref:5'-methylthioadenosine/S-adenosylhomocysteine nucleosidase family protein n=1 Tax=Sphingobium sufflavum TaxID=1129547 RepID=UPI001F36C6C6|nr:purine phosphorylase [Sphingobium sufflavum]MCE7797902.1 purine phosphorylase [Sphingobium sufflavum]
MRIILLAALPEEADTFLPGSGTILDGWPAARRVEALGHEIIVAVTGIGKVNLTTVAATLHARHPADLLAITGTAGKISALPGDCFYLAHAIQHDYGAERPTGFVHFTPGLVPVGPSIIDAYVALPDPGTGLPAARVASGDAFVECPDHARFLSEGLSADVVDMETGALAQFATLAGLPWAGIKATTDDANQDSAGDFRANLAAASARAAAGMEGLIGRL